MPGKHRRANNARRTVALLFAALAWTAGAAEAQDRDVRHWLDRMALAVTNLDYRGSLVYARGDALEAMQIFHRVREGQVEERLVSMSGIHREVLRNADGVRCIFPDRQSVVMDARIAEPWFPVIPSEQVADPGTRYDFHLGNVERIAGMEAQVVEIVPKDQFRYGFRLWLEVDTGMLLKSLHLDRNGRPIEQLMFTDLEIGAMISDADLRPSVREEGFLQVTFPKTPDAGPPEESRSWRVARVPDGFTLRSHTQRGARAGENLEHLVFTDGLASVSVYVEPMPSTGILEGAKELGSVNIFGAQVDGYAVTALGAVPPATVRLMARSVRAVP
ncbi:MAG: MucB/RseB C-terminal domain-containing protein [Pseudomonadota bacterium]